MSLLLTFHKEKLIARFKDIQTSFTFLACVIKMDAKKTSVSLLWLQEHIDVH